MAEKIIVTFLGTGSSVPTARRSHPATLLQYKDEMILFDCGEGTQRQFRKAKINMMKLTAICISHWHPDHTLGLPGLLSTLKMLGYEKELLIYGPKGTKHNLREYLNLHLPNGNGLNIRVQEVGDEIFCEKGEYVLMSKPMDHSTSTNGYAFIIPEKKRLDKEKLAKLNLPNTPLLGKLLQGKTVTIHGKKIDGKKLIYTEPARKISVIIDSRYFDGAVMLAKDSDLLICEASFAAEDEELAESHGHMTSTQAATIAKKAKVKHLVLNHLSQRYDMIPKKIMSEAKEIFKNVSVPDDLDKIEL